MKQKLLKLLSIFVAFLTAIPIANADVTISEPTLVWKYEGTTIGADAYQPAVLPNEKFVVVGRTTVHSTVSGIGDVKTLYIVDGGADGKTGTVTKKSAGYVNCHTGFAADDNGNVALAYFGPNSTTGGVGSGYFYIRKWVDVDGNLGKALENPLDLPEGNLSSWNFYYDATGNLVSGKGHLWFPDNVTKNSIRRFEIKDGVYSSYANYDLGFEFSGGRTAIQVYNSDVANDVYDFVFQPTGEGLYDCHFDKGTITSTEITNFPVSRANKTLAPNMFVVQGKKFLVYPTGKNGNYGNQFVVWNMTDGGSKTIDPFTTTSSASVDPTGWIGCWIQTLKISDTRTDIYVYSPGVGVARYAIIASNPTVSDVTAETFEARPYVATVSWKAPDTKASKYAVSYSTDGGSTWTSTFETTALSYTFTNLPVGTYKFKVAPYFSETSEWGDEVVSNSVEITDPIFYTFTTSNRWEVRGTLGTADAPGGKSIAVSNNKMYLGAPDKYGTMYHVGQSSSSASWDKFDTGYTSWAWGYAMDNDDTGNIIITSNNGISKPTTQFTVYPAGATANTNKKVITLTGNYLPGARFDFMAAQGNVYSGTGYIWFAPSGTKSIKRIKIENVSGTPTPTAVTTWALPMTTSNQVAIRPLDDGRLYFHDRTGSCAIITLPEGGGEVASSMIENLSISATAKGNMNSDVFMLRENTFHVKNDGAASSSIGIEIKNLTTAGNGDASYVPFNGLTPANGNSTVSGVGDYGSMVRAVKVDENTADIYCYSPNHGVTVYRVSAEKFDAVTTPVENLKGEFKFNDVGEIWGRQDVVLTWDEPVGYSGATITGYNIYRDNKLQKTVDASTRTFTDINIVASPTYVVAPLYNGVEMNPTDITIDYTFIPIPPVDLTARTYDGYGSVQLFWKSTTDVGIKPNYYNIYRDGILVGVSQAFNFYEDKLSAGVHKYEVEAVYNEMDDKYISEEYGRAAKSDPVTIIVEARDSEKTTYTLEEIYNYTLDEINNQPANFDNRNYYRQGAYYNGKWYIAQRSDQLCLKDQGVPAGSDYKSTSGDLGSNDARGGVVVFSAEDPRPGVESKPITLLEGTNVGVATDDAGNILDEYDK